MFEESAKKAGCALKDVHGYFQRCRFRQMLKSIVPVHSEALHRGRALAARRSEFAGDFVCTG